MTDKELLELAAKAAVAKNINFANGIDVIYNPFIENKNCFWNPLKDDGDAFRLLNFLRLTIYHDNNSVIIKHKQYSWEWIGETIKEEDRSAATRRAIVRAAAEIGKNM